jgi:hypothetical protein
LLGSLVVVTQSWSSRPMNNYYFQKPKLGCICRLGIGANLHFEQGKDANLCM